MLEVILLGRINEFVKVNIIKFPNPLQCAYQKHISALHASFILQETINYNVEKGSKVYTCLLDTSKAFDVVWFNGLFYKLYKFGIRGNMWRLLRDAYNGMLSSVLYRGFHSRWFSVKQSVRQGGVLLPWLYLLYLDDMLNELYRFPRLLKWESLLSTCSSS